MCNGWKTVILMWHQFAIRFEEIHCAWSVRICVVFGLICLSGCGNNNEPPRFVEGKVNRGNLENPADIVRFQGKLVVAELFSNRLAILDSIDDPDPVYFDPTDIGKSFKAPHHLAVSSAGTLLISNGWGSSIVEISDLRGNGWREFSGVGQQFQAPHGICVDLDGWIYVGDSLNFRIVRFKDFDGTDWQEFSDLDKKIGYARQLLCTEEGVWGRQWL